MQTPTSPSQIHPFDALATIGCIFLGLVTAGFAAFRLSAVLPPGASRNQDQAFFASVNAVTLTGFRQGNASAPNFPALGLDLVAVLAIAGALTTLVGGGYLFARVVRWPISLNTLCVMAAVVVLAPALPLMALGPFNALSASVGLGWMTHVASPFAMRCAVGLSAFGILGVLPIRELFGLSRPISYDPRGYIRIMIALIATLVVGGIVVLVSCGARPLSAAVESLALRGFGGTVPRVDVSTAMPWMAASLAILGGAPASTAGGLSLLPIVVLGRAAWDALRSRQTDPIVGVAIAWVFLFALVAAANVIALAALAPALPADRVMLLACAALANVGVSHESIGLTGASLFLLSAAMLAGRLLSLVMLAWMACVAEREMQRQPHVDQASSIA